MQKDFRAPVMVVRQQKKEWVWRGAVIAAAVLAVVVSIIALVLAGIAFSKVGHYNGELLIHASGALPDSPYPLYLDQAAVPLNLELPIDLTSRVGNVYRVWSLTAQPHTLNIAAMGATWDGTNRMATFGGAIGDGLVFEVTAANQIVVWTINNVVFG